MKLKKHISSSTIITGVIMLLCLAVCNTLLSQPVTIKVDDREDYFERAQAEFKKENLEGAKTIIDEGLKKYPKDSDIRMLAGKYYHTKKQNDKARYELKKALELNPNNVDAKQILVNVETETKRYSSAICYVNELLEVNPYWRGLWRKKIELYDLQGNIVEANRLRKRLSQIYPEDTQLQNDYAYNMEMELNAKRKDGKIDEVIELNKQLLITQPNNVNNYLSLSNDYLKAGDKYNALTYLERGLTVFPGNQALINKKAGILAEQKRYDELLAFLQAQMKFGNTATLQKQYNDYLLEAARNAKNQDPATLYGKILEKNPGNEEAFPVVFNDAVANQQYEEALAILNKYRRVRGGSKALSLKELMVFTRMGNTSRANALTKQLFTQYPNDADLKAAYVKIMIQEAKDKMADEKYDQAIAIWNRVKQHGNEEEYDIAQTAIYNAYIATKDYTNALNVLNELIDNDNQNPDLYVKRADIYLKLKRYNMALTAYEQSIAKANEDEKGIFLGGYDDAMSAIVKDLNQQFRYEEAKQYITRWLQHNPSNQQALRYAVNLAYATKNNEEMYTYAQKGNDLYPDDVFFKLKLIELNALDAKDYGDVYTELHEELEKNPYHEDVIKTFVDFSEKYAQQLIKAKRSDSAISVVDTALLNYAPENKSLKYLKGVAYENIKEFDSAYKYQAFYEPSMLELAEFKQHMNYLNYKTYKNEIGLYHLRARFGDMDVVTSISTVEYTRLEGKNIYAGRLNYTGRDDGKGVQLQGEWNREWNERTRSKIDLAFASKYFPSVAFNASVYEDLRFFNGVEGEFGIGFRKLYTKESLVNFVAGITKEMDPWRINVRLNNFMLDTKWLYSLSTNARYYLSSPKNFILATAGIGSSPDVDVINYQFFNGFSVLNTMVGAGFNHMIAKTVSGGVMGSWYNYKVTQNSYKNLYNLYFSLNVAF